MYPSHVDDRVVLVDVDDEEVGLLIAAHTPSDFSFQSRYDRRRSRRCSVDQQRPIDPDIRGTQNEKQIPKPLRFEIDVHEICHARLAQ